MKRFALFVLLLVFAFSLLGCAGGGLFGGGNSNAGSSNNAGALSVKVNWPAGAKTSILGSTYSLKFNVCTPTTNSSGTTVYLREVNAIAIKHAATNTTENTTINGIPIGPRTVVVQAYDDTGTQIGYGTTSVTITVGDNGGVTITPALGTFGFDFIGKSDVSVPTSGGGGTVTTTTNSYLFVNNYEGNSISVIKETKTTTTTSGVSTSTYSAAVDGTIANVTAPQKGVFNTDGTAYFVTINPVATLAGYKITPNTSNWSSSTVTPFYYLDTGYIPQEILYDNGYLYVSYKILASARFKTGIYKISAATGAIIKQSNEIIFGGRNCEIVGLYKVSTGKFLVAYAGNAGGDDSLSLAVCNDNGTTLDIETGKATQTNWVADKVGNQFYVSGITMPDASTVLVPGAGLGTGNILQYTLNGDDTFTYVNQCTTGAGSMVCFRKVLYNSGTIYGLTTEGIPSGVTDVGNYISYGTLSSMHYGILNSYSVSDFGDMAFSTDKTRIYATDFGWAQPIEAPGGNKVFVRTLSAAATALPDQITVQCRPFGITLKP